MNFTGIPIQKTRRPINFTGNPIVLTGARLKVGRQSVVKNEQPRPSWPGQAEKNCRMASSLVLRDFI